MKRRTAPLSVQPAEGLDEYHDFSKPEDLQRYRDCLAIPPLKDGKLPSSIHIGWREVNGVRVADIRCDGADPGKVIFHIHGGAWNGGVPCTGQRAFIEIADELRLNIVSVEYRLAPEHPYPAGLEDCVSAYLGLLEEGLDPDNIVLMGESAGGNLCLALMLWLKDHGKPLPGGSVLISPGTDFTVLEEKKRAALEHPEDLKLSEDYETYRMYVGDADVRDPYISPIFGDFSGTSPVLVQYGSTEFFAEDGEKIVHRLMADKVDVTAHCWEYMPHVFVLMQDLIPEAVPAKQEIESFMKRILDC